MNEVNWDEAPDGAMRYNCLKPIYPWLLKLNSVVFYHDGKDWMKYGKSERGENDWVNGVIRPTPTDIDTTITQRGERYGKFKDGSVIMQDLKNIMRETLNWEGLTPSQREALEMIQHKIGRILNGDPMYADSWIDISGYSKLIADELNGAIR